jgi:hypothetical protein
MTSVADGGQRLTARLTERVIPLVRLWPELCEYPI